MNAESRTFTKYMDAKCGGQVKISPGRNGAINLSLRRAFVVNEEADTVTLTLTAEEVKALKEEL